MFKNKMKKLMAIMAVMIVACCQISPVTVNASLAESKFASGGSDHTHQYVVSQALAILQNDNGSTLFNTTNNATTLMTYADWPDKLGNETDYATYSGHFYNPHTEKNWMGMKSPTALSRATTHYANAVKAYNEGKVTEALQTIGKGTHYVADLNEPHHASNLTAVNSNHSKFEKYVDQNLALFYIEENTLSKSYYREAVNESVESFLKDGAFYAYDLKEKAQDEDTYFEAAALSVQHAIINAVQYLYAFGVEVGIYK